MSAIDRHVGAKLRDRRRSLRNTVPDVAAALGVTRQDVERIENGSERASAAQLQRLCAFLGLTPADIYEGFTRSPETAVVIPFPRA